MTDTSDHLADFDLWPHLDAVHAAYLTTPIAAGPDQVPPIAESRELLRLFVQIGNDDLRGALVDLLRVMLAN